MAEVFTYPPVHRFEFGGQNSSQPYLFLPALEPLPSPTDITLGFHYHRDMYPYPSSFLNSSGNPDDDSDQSVKKRSLSASSTSSSLSLPIRKCCRSRTLTPSPPQNGSEAPPPPAGTIDYNQAAVQHSFYPPPATSLPFASTPPMPGPSELISAQVGYYQPVHQSRSIAAQGSTPGYLQSSSAPFQTSPLVFQLFPSGYHTLASTPGAQQPPTLPSQHSMMPPVPQSDVFGGNSDIWDTIFDFLGSEYIVLLRLTLMCRMFRDKALLRLSGVTAEEKLLGVLEAENFRKHGPQGRTSGSGSSRRRGATNDNAGPGNFGCFHCFRIRGPEKFENYKWNNSDDGKNDPGSDAPSHQPARRCPAAKRRQDTTSPFSKEASRRQLAEYANAQWQMIKSEPNGSPLPTPRDSVAPVARRLGEVKIESPEYPDAPSPAFWDDNSAYPDARRPSSSAQSLHSHYHDYGSPASVATSCTLREQGSSVFTSSTCADRRHSTVSSPGTYSSYDSPGRRYSVTPSVPPSPFYDSTTYAPHADTQSHAGLDGYESTNARNNTVSATHRSIVLAPGTKQMPPLGENDTVSRRIIETWGLRRFCVDCGIKHGYYRPMDLIELMAPATRGNGKQSAWLCKCYRVHHRPWDLACATCKSYTPLSGPSVEKRRRA